MGRDPMVRRKRRRDPEREPTLGLMRVRVFGLGRDPEADGDDA